MTTYLEAVGGEIATINHLLATLPFDRAEGHPQAKVPYFLDVYRVHRSEMQLLNEKNGRFPLDSSKLLKLGISLGNLLKSLQQDEELFTEQQKKQQQLNKSLGLKPLPPLGPKHPHPHSQSPHLQPSPQFVDPTNPFQERSSAPSYPPPSLPVVGAIGTPVGTAQNPATPAPFQVRFVQNLVKILKNYDIGTVSENSSRQAHLSSISSSTMTTQQHVQTSPIKLSSKQLLIEKLEINIDLDNLFTFKILLKLLVQIYDIIEKQLEITGAGAGPLANLGLGMSSRNNSSSNVNVGTPGGANLPSRNTSSSSSIFSTASYSSTESSTLTLEEYLQVLRQVINRILTGLIEPFVQVIVTDVAEKGIIDRFGELLKSLD